jgi:hypothetical protein
MKTTLALIFASCASLLLISCGNWPYKPTEFIVQEPPPPPDAFVSKDSVRHFIGNDSLILLYTLQKAAGGVSIYFVNFLDSAPVAKKLKMPNDKPDWNADSPLLSPDGSLVTYFLVNPANSHHSVAYCQQLDTAAIPILLDEPASDPHFYKDSSGLFITYADTTGILNGDFTAITGHATYKQQVNPVTGQKIGGRVKIADLPFYGGLSKNGQYLCTGYASAYFYNLASQKLLPVNPGTPGASATQTCNPSMSPSTDSIGRMMFLNIGGIQTMNNMPFGNAKIGEHKYVIIADTNNNYINGFDISQILFFPNGNWQDPEWSNSPDYFTAVASSGDGKWDGYLVSIKTGKAIRLNNASVMTLTDSSTPYAFFMGRN